MPLGEKTTSGLRYSRRIWRRRRWKYCAAVVTLTRCMLGTKCERARGSLVSWRKRSMRELRGGKRDQLRDGDDERASLGRSEGNDREDGP